MDGRQARRRAVAMGVAAEVMAAATSISVLQRRQWQFVISGNRMNALMKALLGFEMEFHTQTYLGAAFRRGSKALVSGGERAAYGGSAT